MTYRSNLRLQEISCQFFLRTNHVLKNGENAIMVRLHYQHEIKEIATGLSVPKEFWVASAGRVDLTYQFADHLNKEIDDTLYGIRQTFEKMKSLLGDFMLDELVQRLRYGGEPPLTLMEYVAARMEDLKDRVGVDLAKTTFYKYRRTHQYLTEFLQLKYQLTNVPLTRVNIEFLDAYFKFLRREKKNGHNSSLTLMNSLKTILQDAVKKGVIRANPFKDLALTRVPVPRDYLTIAEIKALEDLTDLTPKLEMIRDVFIFACYTGLSFSDLRTLSARHIIIDPDGTKHIEKHREKTGVLSYVPLLPVAERVLVKYSPTGNCRDFRWTVYQNTVMNANLKELAKLASIDKKLFMHLARHTFATTITLSNGVPLESVGKMIGHSGMKNLMIYAKVVNTKVKNDMEKLMQMFD